MTDIARLRELAEKASQGPSSWYGSDKAAFAAACGPQTVLALISRVETAEADAAIANEHAEACERAMKLAEAHAPATRKQCADELAAALRQMASGANRSIPLGLRQVPFVAMYAMADWIDQCPIDSAAAIRKGEPG